MGVAAAERHALCELFARVGPDAPTLCEGWRTRDLAAHLVARESRLDATLGIRLPALADRARRVQAGFAALSWPELIQRVRLGPPWWSPFAWPMLGELLNGAEFFVHHEDVRRAQPDWQPRPGQAARDALLWRTMARIAPLIFRRCPVGVVLARPDGARVAVSSGPNPVIVAGEPGELLLFAYGRDQVRLDFDGERAAVDAVKRFHRRI